MKHPGEFENWKTVSSSTNLTDEEIEKMRKEAEENKEADEKRKEEAEVKNEAEQLVFLLELIQEIVYVFLVRVILALMEEKMVIYI